MNTPFFNQIQLLSKNKTRFFVPGHKGNKKAIPLFGSVLPYDITEIEGADNLQMPADTLLQSEQNMSYIYQTGATLYSAGGSSSCIQAMLSLFCGLNTKLVIGRNCHISAVRAMAFLNTTPYWVLPKQNKILPSDIEKALLASGAKVVYITSPDYYGNIQDIKAIAKVCQKYKSTLLVDNAHGAHLKFIKDQQGKDLHPISLGADACADSAHKTLPCLTPAAMLHLKDANLKNRAREALNLYTSTSPSYLVLQSLDLLAGLLLKDKINFKKAIHNFKKAILPAANIITPSDDPLKMCLVPQLANIEFEKLHQRLKQFGIFPELSDGIYIVLMASPYNTKKDFDILYKALLPLKYSKKNNKINNYFAPITLPDTRCNIRTAMFSTKKTISVENSAGCISASLVTPCPPGIPVVIPGECITQQQILLLLTGGIMDIDVIK